MAVIINVADTPNAVGRAVCFAVDVVDISDIATKLLGSDFDFDFGVGRTC